METVQDALDLADLRELAEAGRARVDVVLLTLAEVSAERKALLAQLADTTEDAGRGGGGDEKEYRRRETTLDDELASQQDDATAMLERLETLETLQSRVHHTGEDFVHRARSNQSKTAMRRLQAEAEAAVQRAADLQEELLMAQALSQEMQVDISKKDSELASLRSEVQESQKAKRKSRSDGGGVGEHAAAVGVGAARRL